MNFLTKMYPQDKANHYMRGSFVAGVVAAIFIVIVSAAEKRFGAIPLLWSWALIAAAVVGWLAAFFAGLWKEHMDLTANEEAAARGEPPPHGVEVADWQFTHWGAFPVALPLAIAQLAMTLLK